MAFICTPDRANIQNVSLRLFGTQTLKSTQHPADICSGFKKYAYMKNETSGEEESTLNKLLHIKLDFKTVVLIVLVFSIGAVSLFLRLAIVYRTRQQYKKCKDEKHPRAL